jgi:hypothetical protein
MLYPPNTGFDPHLSFFLSASTAATYIFSAPTCTTHKKSNKTTCTTTATTTAATYIFSTPTCTTHKNPIKLHAQLLLLQLLLDIFSLFLHVQLTKIQ